MLSIKITGKNFGGTNFNGSILELPKTNLIHHKIINSKIKGNYLEDSFVHQYKYK